MQRLTSLYFNIVNIPNNDFLFINQNTLKIFLKMKDLWVKAKTLLNNFL